MTTINKEIKENQVTGWDNAQVIIKALTEKIDGDYGLQERLRARGTDITIVEAKKHAAMELVIACLKNEGHKFSFFGDDPQDIPDTMMWIMHSVNQEVRDAVHYAHKALAEHREKRPNGAY